MGLLSLLPQLVQNRIYLYNFLLLKIVFFNRWLSGLAQEAWGSCGPEAHPPPGLAASPVGRVLRAGLAPMAVPVWLVWAGVLGCVRASGLAWKQLGLSAATCRELLLSCLHSLTPVVLLLLLLTRRLCQRARGRSVVWLLSKVGC